MPIDSSAPDSDLLISILEPALAKQFGPSCQIKRLDRQLSEYHSSFVIEQLDVELSGGHALSILFKNLGAEGLLDEARRTRPACLYEPQRELRVYRELLSRFPIGTAVCHAAWEDPERQQYWLFLEKVAGLELYQIGDFAIWERAAGWLAQFHRLAPQLMTHAAGVGLWTWNRERYWACLERATACVRARAGFGERDDAALQRIVEVYDRVVARLESLPPVVIHGEFYPANILVQETRDGVRICPIDWETAGVGPGLIDVGALVAGQWSDEQREALILAYWRGWEPRATESVPAAFRAALYCCRLHLAVLLLGRSPDWEPPVEHQRDWLAEARTLADQLGW